MKHTLFLIWFLIKWTPLLYVPFMWDERFQPELDHDADRLIADEEADESI